MSKKKDQGGLQLPLWEPQSAWRPTPVSELPSWRGAKRIGLDCETKDLHLKQLGIGTRRGGYMVGYSFSIEDGPKHYVPLRHEGGDNVPEQEGLAYLRDNLGNFDGEICGANLSYDLDYIWNEGVKTDNVKMFRDIQIADPLINELHQSYSLDNIAKRYGFEGKDESLLRQAAAEFNVDPKSGMWRLGGRYVGPYAEQDADQPLKILRKQERIIDQDIEGKDLWEIYDLESQVLPVLVRMRRRGVRIDLAKLEEIEAWTIEQETQALDLIKRETGYSIGLDNVYKATALAPALEAIGVKIARTAKGHPNIDQDLFSRINHPVADAMARARKVNKLRTTFAASIRRYIVDGRIHCTFNQIARETEKGDQKGARYGRVSATDPNLQQQPSRDEFAKMWRSIYLPEEDARWACCDYSQQEPRWTTHFAALMDLDRARETAQAYHDDPMIDNHAFMAKITGIDRKFAKNIYLGLCYGEGGAKLCDDLGLPSRWALSYGNWANREMRYFESQEEAQAMRSELGEGYVYRAAGEEGQTIIDTFDERAPFISQLATAAKKRANQRGMIVTPFGRRLHFPQRPDGSYDWTHKALNRLIQGTGADQMKKALVEIDKAGYWLMLQVHDETDSSVSSDAEAKKIAEIMSDSMSAKVPFRVDIEMGDNWGYIG